MVPCDHCGGTGKVLLSAVLFRVVEAVTAGHRTAKEVSDHLSGTETVGKTAINNRLEELREYGLLTRKKVGRFYVYDVVKGEEKTSAFHGREPME